MKKTLIIIVLALVALMGTSSAYQVVFYDETGTVVNEENPLKLYPGTSITLSYYASGISALDVNDYFPYSVVKKEVSLESPVPASADDIEIVFNNLGFNPSGNSSYMDTEAITISVKETAPVGALYTVEIGAGNPDDMSSAITEFQTVSKSIESIPEFPTVALPIAAILGLAFFMQRRKEE